MRSFRMSIDRMKPARRERLSGPGAGSGSRRQLGIAAGLMATILVALRLGLPWAVEPMAVPFPQLETSLLQQQQQERSALRDRAHSRLLPLSVRAVGELVRRAGRAEAERNRDAFRVAQGRLSKLVSAALTETQSGGLLQLRELQTELFEQAVLGWDGSMPESDDLLELGGGFARHTKASLAGGRLRWVRAELAAAFRLRWAELVGLDKHPDFAPVANDLRLNARLRLRMAEVSSDGSKQGGLLTVIDTVASLDPDYPAHFAKGVVHYKNRAFKEAFDSFKAHLEERPDGPWTLRAQNHALASAEALLGAD